MNSRKIYHMNSFTMSPFHEDQRTRTDYLE